MRVIIPVAGLGSRLKPHTFTTPKPLMDVAGKPILDFIITEVAKLNPSEVIFIVGYKKLSIKRYIDKFHPNLNVSFVEQKTRDGDGSAIRLGLENIDCKKDDDLMVIFGDTLIDFNIKSAIKKNFDCDALIFGMEVEEPKHYGIMNINSVSKITSVEEKPKNPKSNLAIIGAYYFKSSILVKNYLEDFLKKEISIDGEYKIVQVIEKLIKKKNTIVKASKVKKWFDCGRPEVLLEANKYFLTKFSSGIVKKQGTSLIIPPSFIAKSAKIENSIIGPYASIGKDCIIKDSIIKNSVVNIGAQINSQSLEKSLLGKEVILSGKTLNINIGDKSQIHFN